MEHARHPEGLFFFFFCDRILHGTHLLELISVPSGQCAYSPTALIPRLEDPLEKESATGSNILA